MHEVIDWKCVNLKKKKEHIDQKTTMKYCGIELELRFKNIYFYEVTTATIIIMNPLPAGRWGFRIQQMQKIGILRKKIRGLSTNLGI